MAGRVPLPQEVIVIVTIAKVSVMVPILQLARGLCTIVIGIVLNIPWKYWSISFIVMYFFLACELCIRVSYGTYTTISEGIMFTIALGKVLNIWWKYLYLGFRVMHFFFVCELCMRVQYAQTFNSICYVLLYYSCEASISCLNPFSTMIRFLIYFAYSLWIFCSFRNLCWD